MRVNCSRRQFLAGALGLPSAVAACGDRTMRYQSPSELKIVLAQNPWTGSALDVAIARYLMEDQLGLAVTAREVSEADQWELLARGELHASLEIWPLRNVAAMQQYAATGIVEDGGQLGPVARAGWYVPSYVMSDYPEIESWVSFKDPKIARIFSTPQTGDKGQLLTGDPSWSTRDVSIVTNLGLQLNVVYAGGEDQLLPQIHTAYQRRAPILFYLWFPHWAHGVYDFASVDLPTPSPECTSNQTCGYPAERLLKMFWPNFKTVAPRAHGFLKNFKLDATTQVSLAASARLQKQSVEGAARNWISRNTKVWSPWIPPRY